ncbi:molybdenum cofactor biosynthesis protein MoaE [uncultured Thiothrix sp.]|uniref:molybdenum cofactor biosynthesis protein MoaE n=1 Tax=uncultured Thiothrix sp. TaxID=223185 RepID=UPI00263A0A0D|nr:molybdenum cofactor biosynthesis protein MoaE [uncultured Thiothrix sp.]HMT93025.1 molybdenum cofactor biosynthesis protein MoaE [Thiolinea sp.]
MIEITITDTAFDPWQAIQVFQQQPSFNAQQSGANAIFVGTMRDFNAGDLVQAMRLEHYPAMTQKHLQQLVDKACTDWGLNHVLLIHRVGTLIPAEPIVLVAVWSDHRRASFEACRQIMEDLKHQAPFWKQETLNDGSQRWVEKNTAG